MAEQDMKISDLPALETVSGDELLVVAKGGGNGSVTTGQIVAKARQGLVAQVPGKGLSTNDFTDVLKAKLDSLKNYDDAALRAAVDALERELDTILGDGASAAIDTFNEIEAFLTGITDTQTLTGLLAELKSTITGETDTKLEGKVDKVSGKGLSANDYSDVEKGKLAGLPTGAELETALASKLDKTVWDGEHAQFNIVGYYSVNSGRTGTAKTWRRTPLVVLNRNAPIVFKDLVLNSDAGIVFFDADGKFISGLGVDSGLNASQQIAVADFPEGAVYVGLSTYVANAGDNHNVSYTNGETVESREGAIAERFIADKQDREKENAQFGLSGYWYNNGRIQPSDNYRRTGLIPVSHDYDIVTHCWGTVNVMALILFDVAGGVVDAVPCNSTGAAAEKAVTVAAADIPAAAVYFAASTTLSHLAESSWSNGPTREAREGAVSDAAAAAHRAMFDRIYAAYGVKKDAATGLYSLNGLTDITEAEMLAIYTDVQRAPDNVMAGDNHGNLRTNLWVATGVSASDNEITVNGLFDGWLKAEVLNVFNGYDVTYTTKISGNSVFKNCRRLKKILGVFRLFTQDACSRSPFVGCAALEELTLAELKYSVSFADSPLLSLASLEYLVANAANTGPITVTVHPTVYAKLTDTDGLEDYLPANMVKTQGAARSMSTNCSYADEVWTIQRQDRDTYLSLRSDAITAGRPYAISMNVDGMAEGEEWQFYLNGGTASGAYFKMKQGACSGVLYPKSSTSDDASIDDVSRKGVDMSLTTPITVTDIMVVPGETAAPKWAPHPDEIEDAELRERVKWANLVYVAAAKQITFASV